MMGYGQIGGIYLPAHGVEKPAPTRLRSNEDEAAAKALFDADPCGKLMVTFDCQPEHVRAKYFAPLDKERHS